MKDREAFEKLVSEHYGLVYKYCFVKLGHDDEGATECANDTFMILAGKFDGLDLSGNVAGWLVKTAQNCILKYKEREARYRSRVILPDDDGAFEQIEDDSPGVEESVIAKLSGTEMLSIIERSLDPGEAELFRLHYLEEKNPTQIAAELEMPYTTARMRLKRLETKLRRVLSEGTGGAPPEPKKRGRPKKERNKSEK